MAALPARAEPVTLLAFGDSLVQGYGLPKGAGFTDQLQAFLRKQGRDVVVVNGGVSGETTTGALRRVDWSMNGDVDAVLVAIGGNDLLRGTPINTIEANLDQIIARMRAKGVPVLLVGYRATANYGPEYKGVFDELYPAVAKRHGVLFHPYIFQGMVSAYEAGQVSRAEVFQNDGIHPNAKGVAYNIAAMGPAVLKLVDAARVGTH